MDNAEYNQQKILVHCLHGQDRTGLVIGLRRIYKGWNIYRSWRDMLGYGFHSILLGLTYYFWKNANDYK